MNDIDPTAPAGNRRPGPTGDPARPASTGLLALCDQSLTGVIDNAARTVNQLVDELIAADLLITELVAENERLREQLAQLDTALSAPRNRPPTP